MVQRYPVKWSSSVVAGYCLTFRRDCTHAKRSRKQSTVTLGHVHTVYNIMQIRFLQTSTACQLKPLRDRKHATYLN